MERLTDYRAIFLKPNGELVYYPMKVGDNHQQLLFDFCKKNNIAFPSIESLLNHSYGAFYHANNGIIIGFLPESLTEEEYYTLDLQTCFMDDIHYMEVKIHGKMDSYTLQGNIGEEFSKKVIQYYFSKDNNLISSKHSK